MSTCASVPRRNSRRLTKSLHDTNYMIVKIVGKKLIALRAHQLAIRIAPLVILLFVYLFITLPLNTTPQQFQQPTLHPKLFDLKKPRKQFNFNSHDFLRYIKVPGRTPNEALLLAFNSQSPYSQQIAHLVAQQLNVIYPTGPTKTLLVVGFPPNRTTDFLSAYNTGELPFHAGVIRLAIYLDLDSNNSSRLFFKMFQKHGMMVDSDYFFAMEVLMKATELPFFFCQNAATDVIRTLTGTWNKVLKWGGLKARGADIRRLLESWVCQLSSSYGDPSFTFLKQGIMSSTLQGSGPQQPLITLLLSFLGSMSFPQDSLHSSWTLYLPTFQSIITIQHYTLPMVAAIVWVASPVVYQYYTSTLAAGVGLHPGVFLGAVGAAWSVAGWWGMLGVAGIIAGWMLQGHGLSLDNKKLQQKDKEQEQTNNEITKDGVWFWLIIHKIALIFAIAGFMIVRLPHSILALLHSIFLRYLHHRVAGMLMILCSCGEIALGIFDPSQCSAVLLGIGISLLLTS